MITGVVLLYLARLFYIQILDTRYSSSANNNALYHRTIYPVRGVIFDRNGEVLVGNSPSFDVIVTMRNVRNLDTLDLCRSLDITKEYFVERMAEIRNVRRNPGYSAYTRQVFMSQLSVEEISVFRENLFRFDGFDIEERTLRNYSYSVGAHLLGDMGEVSKSDIEDDDYYVQGDFIGKQGVEKFYEKILRGKKGVEIMLKDAYGRIQGSYMDGQTDISPEPGRNVKLGIDIGLQALGERLMQNKIGSIVAIEPETGEILCMVSSPTFDPSELKGRHRGDNYRVLAAQKDKPLLNRTIQGTYPPGSTFKTAQALTFLQEGIIDTETRFPCTGGFVFRGLRVGCHAHSSPLSLLPAIATSCNGFFCWGYYRMIGADKPR